MASIQKNGRFRGQKEGGSVSGQIKGCSLIQT
jgi:hypothetical protein